MLSKLLFFLIFTCFLFFLTNFNNDAKCFYIPKVHCAKYFYLKDTNDVAGYSDGYERYIQVK